MSNLIDSPKLSIEKMLNDPISLQVPPWQRFYSWTSNEIEDFWYDITNFAEVFSVGRPDYFVGTLIVVNPTGRAERLLLDGQQRLATSVILLACLRDVVRGIIAGGGVDIAGLDSQIEERCIKTKNFSTGLDQRRLRLTDQDDAFFERHIVNSNPLVVAERRLKPSQRLLWRAKNFFLEKLKEVEKERAPDDFKAWIVKLQQVIRDNVVAIAVTMDDENNAISVFETLNDRGVSLSTSELVRANLLQLAPDHRPAIISLWQTIFDLEGQPRHKNLLRHIWMADHGDVKARALSKTIKDDLDARGASPTQALAFAQEASDKAARYADIVAANLSDPDLNLILREVASLGAQSLYPALLSAVQKWPSTNAAEKAAIRSYAQALVNGYFRHVTIGELEGSKYEKLAYGQAEQISKGLLNSPAGIVQIKGFVPVDGNFEADFAVKSLTGGVAQYLLRKIETAMRGPTSATLVASPRDAHVEHIYPQSPAAGDRWADHEEWVNRIGNLTLLAGSVNRGLSNANYATKLPVYSASDILLTKEVANNFPKPLWLQGNIDARQLDLASKAVTIWNF